jgi:VCBS repeat-containing protein
VTVTIAGSNDAAVITGTSAVNLTETDAVLTATGTLSATDVDSAAAFVAQTNAAGSNGYGTFSITAAGAWGYTANTAHNEFLGGQTYTDSITVATGDGTEQVVTVSIAGTNDAATFTGAPFIGSVQEITGVPVANSVLTNSGTIEFTDAEGFNTTHSVGAVTASTGALGSLTVTKTADTNGVGTVGALTWHYSVDAAAVEYLAAGETKEDLFRFTLVDERGDFTASSVAVTLTGTNDAPTIVSGSTIASGEFSEAVATTGSSMNDIVTNSITFADTDLIDTHTVSVTGTNMVWSNGTLTQAQQDALAAAFHLDTKVDSTGHANGTQAWHFSAPDATFDFLAKNDTLTITYKVTFDDGHGSTVVKDVVITAKGTNDAAVITGTSTASLTETDVVLTATGSLSATDVDSAATFAAQTNVAGSNGCGKFSIGTTGAWSYTANTAHNEFVGGTAYTDSITVATTDGMEQIITVTIAGTNDAAAITGTSTASLTEAKTVLTATGTLSAADVDSPADFVAQTNVAGSNGYGHFSITAAGVWSYKTTSAHGEFISGTNYTDSITVTTADGTAQVVSVTIAGSNNGAVITGPNTASLTETDAVLTATGTLVATDLDSPTTFVAQTNVAGNHGYGHFSIGTDGVWSYTADNAHNEFAAGTTYTDSMTVATADGTQEVLTVTIAGTNDVAVISGTSTANLIESNAILKATGTLLVADVDSATTFVAQTDVAGNHGYGKFSIGTDGVWNYTAGEFIVGTNGVLSFTATAHNELAAGETHTDTITVATADGTEQIIAVTTTGVDDPAVLSSAISTLPESSILRTTGGTLTISDADSISPAFVAQSGTPGTYGTFVLGTNGVWSYTFNEDVVFDGTTYSDVFNVFSADGTATTVSVFKTSAAISLGNDSTGGALVAVAVPEGIGFSEQHSTETTLGTLRDQLIAASEPKVDDTVVFNEILQGGIDAYVPTVDDQQQVTIRTITFNSETGAVPSEITIDGAQGTGEDDPLNPLRQEALVVDARLLPSGTILNFNNVEFAIVIGAVQLNGGDGRNFVIGDESAQWIVLGAGDDTLYGGGGDDTIGSHGGNDLLYGDAGNDTLSGGIDNDTLEGGSGDDVLYGDESTDGGDGIDTAMYDTAVGGVTVDLRYGTVGYGTATSTAGGDAAGIGTDILYDIENIVGGGYNDMITGNDVANKLEGGKGNDTLTGGKGNDILDGGSGMNGGGIDMDTAVFSGNYAAYSISYNAVNNTYTLGGVDGTDIVTNVEKFQFTDGSLFNGGPGSETFTGTGVHDTLTYLRANAGVTVDLANYTAYSSTAGDAASIGTDTLSGIENVVGGDYADTLTGDGGNNQLTGAKGNDTLDGASGTDTVVFSGNYADYTITYDATKFAYIVTDGITGRDGVDTVINNLENFRFADGDVYNGGAGDEIFTGTGVNNTVTYMRANAGIIVNLATGIAKSAGDSDAAGIGTDTLSNIHNVIGGDYADTLTGDGGNNQLTGGKGNDTIIGGGGTDTVVFSGNLADYDVTYNAATGTYTITDKIVGRDGTDTVTVTNVHNFQFAGVTHQDIVKPTVGTFTPGSGATGVGVGNDVVLTFNESIHSGTGTIAIHSGSTTGPVVASSADATSATVTVFGSTLTINPTHDLAYNTHYYVTLADGSVYDAANNSYSGTTTYDFTTGADPYAGGSHDGGSGSSALIGLGVLGVLAWAIF